MPADYYETLGIERSASADEIKKAYRKAALKYHPDRNPGDAAAEDRFKQAAEAYAVLGDDEKRRRYDQFGHQGVGGAAPNFNADIFADFSDILGGFFGFDLGGFGGRGAGAGPGPARGNSLQYRLEIDLEQAATGDEIEIRVPRQRTCTTCEGSGSASGSGTTQCSACRGRGQVQQRHGFLTIARTCGQCGGAGQVISDPCTTCRGAGREQENATLKVRVPAGVDTGMRLLLRGEGESGVRGGPPGDLAVLIEIRDHERYLRRGEDLLTRVPVSYPMLALGGEIDVDPLVGDAATLTIPAGTQSGAVLTVRGRGMPSVNGGRTGDLQVAVQLVTPRKLNDRERELLRELRSVTTDPTEIDEERSWWDRLRDLFD